MASERPTRILKSKTDMTLEEIAELTDAEAWRLIYSLGGSKNRKPKDNRPQICFTGFSAGKKEALTNLASNHGFKVVTSVTLKLDYLVSGESPGSNKLEKAKSQGVPILNEEEFIRLIETGECKM